MERKNYRLRLRLVKLMAAAAMVLPFAEKMRQMLHICNDIKTNSRGCSGSRNVQQHI